MLFGQFYLVIAIGQVESLGLNSLYLLWKISLFLLLNKFLDFFASLYVIYRFSWVLDCGVSAAIVLFKVDRWITDAYKGALFLIPMSSLYRGRLR